MAEINCPMCGKPNPEMLDVCQFCEARLKPLTDELSRSQPPIHPGDEPRPMDTGELEPVLPQWLREVRQQSRESAEEEPERAQMDGEAIQPEKPADLLAGLQSEGEDDEEIPDWLAGLRGEGGQALSEEDADDDLAALKSMFGEDASTSASSEEGSLPGWISDLGESEPEAKADGDALSALLADETQDTSQPTEAQSAAPSSDLEWAADLDSESIPEQEHDSNVFKEGTPDWLSSLDAEGAEATPEQDVTPAVEGEIPDWLSSLGDDNSDDTPSQEITPPVADSSTSDWKALLGDEHTEAPPQEVAAAPAFEGDMPDWLSSPGDESADEIPPQEATPPAIEGNTPDWLASLGEESAEVAPQEEPTQPALEGETPDWLSTLGEESAEETPEQQDKAPAVEDEMPDWYSSLGEDNAEEPSQQEVEPAIEGDMPDWLGVSEDDVKVETGEQATPTTAFVEDGLQPASEDETPDWLSSLGGDDSTATEQPGESAFVTDELVQEEGSPSAFVDDEGDPLATNDVDALLSMDMPDWLSDVDGESTGDAGGLSAGAQTDDLRPAELPNWVQAMRPVESVIDETEGEGADDQPLEEQGPLAGLRGVLPAVPGVGPSSKPKAYSIKLQASDDQQSNAVMLEQMLAEEINPKPIITEQVALSQRVLRWAIAFLLLLVIGGTVFTGTQINPMPTGAPLETSNALRYIQETLPADAPVLLVFDYEAALAGELEAAASPLIDHMLLLKHPRLSMIASTPVGTGLAELFMTNTQSDHNYQRGQQFINLGYVPGGATGVLAFSENPVKLKPLSNTGDDAWTTPVLRDVGQLSDFSAIILLTSDAESARVWIEQTESMRGETEFLVVSSAQSGPMILPYVQSGQVDGMVTGIDGSAPIEQANSGRPGLVRRYWDAYGFGLLTAIMLIAVGSLWSMVTGLQVRRKEQIEE